VAARFHPPGQKPAGRDIVRPRYQHGRPDPLSGIISRRRRNPPRIIKPITTSIAPSHTASLAQRHPDQRKPPTSPIENQVIEASKVWRNCATPVPIPPCGSCALGRAGLCAIKLRDDRMAGVRGNRFGPDCKPKAVNIGDCKPRHRHAFACVRPARRPV